MQSPVPPQSASSVQATLVRVQLLLARGPKEQFVPMRCPPHPLPLPPVVELKIVPVKGADPAAARRPRPGVEGELRRAAGLGDRRRGPVRDILRNRGASARNLPPSYGTRHPIRR